jgi:hypothetical protein
VGLNVYFCDVCGVRVTDVDLRSGHGMLRGQDVICATCLEMGHGKEWLSARGGEQALVSAAPAVGAQAGYAKLLDHARDRAVTVPDDHADHQSGADDLRHPQVHDAAEVRQQDHEDTGLVDSIPAEFSGAAASFAALSQTSGGSQSSTPTGDISEDIIEEMDHLLSTPKPPATRQSSDAHQASPFVEKSPDDDDSSALISINKSRSSSRSGVKSAESKGGSGARKSAASSSRVVKPSSLPSTTKKTTSSASIPAKSSSSTKIGKPKTGRSGRASTGGMPKQLRIALITVPLILLIAVGIIVSRGGGSAKVGEVHDLKAQQSQISKNFTAAQQLVNDAWVSKDVNQMKAAETRWKQFMNEWDEFSNNAKKYSHWTEDNCNDYWEGLHAPDVNSRTRLLRDEISKQTSH